MLLTVTRTGARTRDSAKATRFGLMLRNELNMAILEGSRKSH